jgi:hypothetical protein
MRLGDNFTVFAKREDTLLIELFQDELPDITEIERGI